MLAEEIQKKLYFTYRFAPKKNKDNFSILNEEHGVPDIIDTISVVFRNYLKQWMHKNRLINKFKFTNKDLINAGLDVNDLFFKYLYVQVTVDSGKNAKSSFAYESKENNFKDNKLVNCVINGRAVVNPDNINDGLWSITANFAHELLHAYEDWQRLLSDKEGLVSDVVNKYGYGINQQFMEYATEIDEKKLSQIIYHLTPQEIRAYAVQLIKRIEPQIKMCTSSQQAYHILKNTIIWKNYEMIEKWVNDIVNGKIYCKPQDIEEWWFDIRGKHLSYNKICKRLKEKMERAKKYLINVTSKKIGDIALKNDKWIYLT